MSTPFFHACTIDIRIYERSISCP